MKKVFKFFIVVFVSCFLVSCGGKNSFVLPKASPDTALENGTSIINPDSEIRGVWIASVFNINYPSAPNLSAQALQAELDTILDTCEQNSLNTVFFQVRPACDALYESEIFPVSKSISTDGQLTFDALKYLVEVGRERNIRIHAWINPLRVTLSADSEDSLSENSPAKLHPEWCVKYADEKLYFNAGLPEVRALIADGVREIVENYDVDGVVFDDYFYPYPINGEDFNDADAFAKYGGGFTSMADWRRSNVNEMVKASYEAVKSVDSDCVFGVSPTGIWQNNDGKNGGSDTTGFEAYKTLYCDALAWVDGGYVDYISPQIYWNFETLGTPFDTVVKWWNSKLDGTGVELWVSHGVYRYSDDDWGNISGEMERQVEYCRNIMSYRGSMFYGYDKLKANTYEVSSELNRAFLHEVIYCDSAATGEGVYFVDPYIGKTCEVGTVELTGRSDPSETLSYNSVPVGRNKNGEFTIKLKVSRGENRYVFLLGDREYVLLLYGE